MSEHDEIEVPDGIRREVERLRRGRASDADETPRLVPAMPRPRGREITPVLSPEQRADLDGGPEPDPRIDAGATVLHAPSGVVGVVKRVHGPGEYLVRPAGSETSGRPVSEPVVELEDGNAFLFRRGSFVVLDGKAPVVYAACVKSLAAWIEVAGNLASAERVEREVGAAMIRSVLSTQLRALSGVAEVGRVPVRATSGAEADCG